MSWGHGPPPRRRSGPRPCPRPMVLLPSAGFPCRSQASLGGKLGIQREDNLASFTQHSREPDFRPVSLAPPWGGVGMGKSTPPCCPQNLRPPSLLPAPSLSGLFSNILALSLALRCLHRDSPPTSCAPRTGSYWAGFCHVSALQGGRQPFKKNLMKNRPGVGGCGVALSNHRCLQIARNEWGWGRELRCCLKRRSSPASSRGRASVEPSSSAQSTLPPCLSEADARPTSAAGTGAASWSPLGVTLCSCL